MDCNISQRVSLFLHQCFMDKVQDGTISHLSLHSYTFCPMKTSLLSSTASYRVLEYHPWHLVTQHVLRSDFVHASKQRETVKLVFYSDLFNKDTFEVNHVIAQIGITLGEVVSSAWSRSFKCHSYHVVLHFVRFACTSRMKNTCFYTL